MTASSSAPPPPAPRPPADEALSPYLDPLAEPEDTGPVSLTFNVAEQAPAGRPEAPAPTPDADAPLPGTVAKDDPPAWVPPLPADHEPLLQSPVRPAPRPAAAPEALPPPAVPRLADLGDVIGGAATPAAPPAPAAWSATEQMALQASARASRPMPLDDFDDDTLIEGDTQQLSHGGLLQSSAEPEADTVIAVQPVARRRAQGPSPRLLAVLLAALLALWLVRLGGAPLFDVDEGAFAESTREMVTSHDWGSTTLNGADRFDKPILVYWLQAASLKVFGANEFAVRLPSALCAYLWCVATGLFAWRRYGAPVAIAAAGILATSLLPMAIGRAATADALLNLLLALSIFDLWRHLESGRDAPRRRAFAFIGLGLLAKGPVAVLIPGAAAALWLFIGRDRSRLLRLVADRTSWLLMIGIALPWYAYALWRHGMAFVDGFLLHHNIDRFTGSLEGHAGSLFYYVELLPLLMLPWTPLLAPLVLRLRTRWIEPLGRFLLLWFGFVMVFFSLSGTKLPHYVLYGYTPLVLLIAQELVQVRRAVRWALCACMVLLIGIGSASHWIAQSASHRVDDALYHTLLSTAPATPWAWLGVPVAALVFALVVWIPNVRSYLSEADGAVAAGVLTAAWLVVAVLPWWALTLQAPIRTLANTVPIAQLNLLDREPVVQWKLHQPSFAFYLGTKVERHDPVGGDWALTRVDRLTPAERARLEVVQQSRGYALVRPTPAASEPLARLGAAPPPAASAPAGTP